MHYWNAFLDSPWTNESSMTSFTRKQLLIFILIFANNWFCLLFHFASLAWTHAFPKLGHCFRCLTSNRLNDNYFTVPWPRPHTQITTTSLLSCFPFLSPPWIPTSQSLFVVGTSVWFLLLAEILNPKFQWRWQSRPNELDLNVSSSRIASSEEFCPWMHFVFPLIVKLLNW